MDKVVVIRIGEIFLKGKNREYFESLLIKNIRNALKGVDCGFSRTQGRYYVENFAPEDEFEILSRLQRVFGIHSLSVADKVKTLADEDFSEIRASLSAVAAKIKAQRQGKILFRVTVKRADKRIAKNSAEIAADLGGTVLSLGGFKVSLKDFEFDFHVDIRENGCSLVYTDTIAGAGGLPVGCSGRGMLLLSGGIDSPVAAYMMAKRGMKLFAVHFSSPPYTSEKAKEKVVELRDIVQKYAGEIPLFVVPFTEIQLAIHKNCPANYMITIMRRFMMRIACRLAENTECSALVTGESLGQVASQTVESMTCTGDTATLPIFRPLIGFDKDEIMVLAQKIGTYDTSILPYEDCCTVFLPKSPAIKPALESVRRAEIVLNIDALIENAVNGAERL